MRTLSMLLVLLSVGDAFAQEPPGYRDPYATPPPATMPPPDPTAVHAQPTPLSRSLVRQWRGARVMNGFAGAIGIVSAGLSLSSAIYVAADHYPPSVSAFAVAPKPSDPAQALSYVSATSSVFAFGLSAGGLGWRHHILRKLDADPGRGLFLSGTVVGLVGIVAIATSYLIGFTNVVNPHDQSIVVLATSLGGSAICNVGTTLYAKDASRLQKAWKSLTTF